MADSGQDRDGEGEPGGLPRLAKVAAVAIDLRDGFRAEPRSPEYRAIHGLAADVEDSHEDWIGRVHPQDRDGTVKYLQDAVSGATEQVSYQYRIIRPSGGEVRWVATGARNERSPDGKPLRFVGAHIDITDIVVAKET